MPKKPEVQTEGKGSAPESTGEKRLAAKAGIGQGGGWEGVEKIDKTEIEGQEVILVDFRFGSSKFHEGKDFVMLLIEVDGEQRSVNIGGQVVVEGLKNVKKDEDLPAPVIFLKKKTEDGKRTFWTME